MAYFQRRRLFVTVVAVFLVFTLLQFSGFEFTRDLSSSLQLPFSQPKIKPLPWNTLSQKYPIAPEDMLLIPSGPVTDIPKIQFDFPDETAAEWDERIQRREAVKDAFIRSWIGYTKYAWLHDEVTPLSKSFKDPFGGWGATLVDNLDTLYIMGMHKEFATAVAALKKIDFSRPSLSSLNVFETTIRYLGGLLSAYDLSDQRYPILLQKATQLGEMLYHAFDTPNRMPSARWDWQATGQGIEQKASSNTLSAELGSLSMEFTRLSQITGDSKYFDAVQRITNVLEKAQDTTKIPGLWPIVVNAQDLVFDQETFTFGGMSDSMYEYLPKVHMLLGGQTSQYKQMYEKVLAAAKESLFFRPYNPDNIDMLIAGTANSRTKGTSRLQPQGQHLTCFAGGMVAIASKVFSSPENMYTARRLVRGCIWASNSTTTGIHPEIFQAVPCNSRDCSWTRNEWYEAINAEHTLNSGSPEPSTQEDRANLLIHNLKLPEGFTSLTDKRYLLRPEVIESLFIMYRVTGDKSYQDTAWQLFQNIMKACKTDISFAGIHDVMSEEGGQQIDSSESFWMAETLKYLYLIFSDTDTIKLDEWVFNTEAHPLKRPKGD